MFLWRAFLKQHSDLHKKKHLQNVFDLRTSFYRLVLRSNLAFDKKNNEAKNTQMQTGRRKKWALKYTEIQSTNHLEHRQELKERNRTTARRDAGDVDEPK